MNPKEMSQSMPSGKFRSNSEEDFETCFMELYKRFNSPVVVSVVKGCSQRDNKSPKTREIQTKHKRVSIASAASDVSSEVSESIKDRRHQTDEIILPITATYDTQNHLSALLIAKFKEETIPRVAIQLLALILPNYQQLYKFTIKNSHIDMYVVHELGKILPYTTITDVCLDDCPLKQANYEELLQNTTFLKNLSLCRCNINDAVCERIASKLHFLESAENSLATLNLTSNRIGDEGAKYLAEALRSNRHLRYLNLADNLISDDGAFLIFNIFIEFPLTYDENKNRRQRLMIYLKKKREIYMECLHKLGVQKNQKSPPESIHSNANKARSQDKIQVVLPPKRGSHTQVKRKSVKRESAKSLSLSALTEDNLPKKAELIAKELVGPFVDPFCTSCMRIKDYPRCIGNFVLCYLNLAYNHLTYMSVRKLLSVVEYQKVHYKPDAGGLVRVVLDGNSLPVACTELMILQKMLNQHETFFHSNKGFNISRFWFKQIWQPYLSMNGFLKKFYDIDYDIPKSHESEQTPSITNKELSDRCQTHNIEQQTSNVIEDYKFKFLN